MQPNDQWQTPAPFLPGPDPSGVLLDLHPDPATFWRGVGARAAILLPIIALGVWNAVRRDGLGWAVVLYGGSPR